MNNEQSTTDPAHLAALKRIAGDGDLDERCHNLALYFFGPPPPPLAPPKPLTPRQRATLLQRIRRRAARGRWVRCEWCSHYLASDGTCPNCNPSIQSNKETA